MTKQEIEAIAERQRAVAQRNYMAYQETGIGRYESASRRAEDVVELCERALAADDDHRAASNRRMNLIDLGAAACEVLHHGVLADPAGAERVLRDAQAYASLEGYRDPWGGD